jgi:hypothetical protein
MQRSRILFKAPDIRQEDFNELMKEEIDNLVSIIWRNQR